MVFDEPVRSGDFIVEFDEYVVRLTSCFEVSWSS